MTDNEKLVDDLIQVAYDSGYYSGKGQDGEPHHLEAIEKRKEAARRMGQRLDAMAALLLGAEEALATLVHHQADIWPGVGDMPVTEMLREAIDNAKEDKYK